MEGKEEEKGPIDVDEDRIYVDLVEGKPTPDITSMCMNCHGSGVTKFMLLNIPFFKEIMVSAFSCEECGFKNSEVSFAGRLDDYGIKYEVNVVNPIAFNR